MLLLVDRMRPEFIILLNVVEVSPAAGELNVEDVLEFIVKE